MALPLSKMDVHRQQYSEEKSSTIPLKRAGTDNDSRQSPSVMHGDESNEMDPRNVVPVRLIHLCLEEPEILNLGVLVKCPPGWVRMHFAIKWPDS